MTNDNFLEGSLNRFNRLATIKFFAGSAQHGGKLWEKKDLIKKAKDECIDQWFYLDALEKQLEDRTIFKVNGVDIDEKDA